MVLDAKRAFLCVLVCLCALERARAGACVYVLPVSTLGHKAAASQQPPRLSAHDCVLAGGLGGFTLNCIVP